MNFAETHTPLADWGKVRAASVCTHSCSPGSSFSLLLIGAGRPSAGAFPLRNNTVVDYCMLQYLFLDFSP